MTSIPANQRPIAQGGLMRCCIETIVLSEEPSDVGTVIACMYEDRTNPTTMIVRDDGAWHWNHP